MHPQPLKIRSTTWTWIGEFVRSTSSAATLGEEIGPHDHLRPARHQRDQQMLTFQIDRRGGAQGMTTAQRSHTAPPQRSHTAQSWHDHPLGTSMQHQPLMIRSTTWRWTWVQDFVRSTRSAETLGEEIDGPHDHRPARHQHDQQMLAFQIDRRRGAHDHPLEASIQHPLMIRATTWTWVQDFVRSTRSAATLGGEIGPHDHRPARHQHDQQMLSFQHDRRRGIHDHPLGTSMQQPLMIRSTTWTWVEDFVRSTRSTATLGEDIDMGPHAHPGRPARHQHEVPALQQDRRRGTSMQQPLGASMQQPLMIRSTRWRNSCLPR